MQVVLALSDTVRCYTRETDETEKTLRAEGVAFLEDLGTWECDALVRMPELDVRGEGDGYGIVDIEGMATLRFRARSLDLGT